VHKHSDIKDKILAKEVQQHVAVGLKKHALNVYSPGVAAARHLQAL